MPLTLVVRTVSTARRPVWLTYWSIDSTRSRRLDLNAGDISALTSSNRPRNSSRAAMATGKGRPRKVWADSRPIIDESTGAAAASAGGTFAPDSGTGAAAVGCGVDVGAAPKSTVDIAVKGFPFAVP